MLNIAIVPSCNTFESHFTALGVTPSALADGEYRGTWITQYAALFRRNDMQVTLVVPGAEPGLTRGQLMNVSIVPTDPAYARVPERIWRWRLRAVGSELASRGLHRHLHGFDVVYLQEYAYGRAGYLAKHLRRTPVVAAHHGASIAEAPRRVVRRLSAFSALTALTRTELDALRAEEDRSPMPAAEYRPNWVDGRFFDVQDAVPHEGHVVWSGRFDARIKGLGTLLTAFAELDPACTLELIGGGPDWDRVRSQVDRDPRLRDRVALTGRIDDLTDFLERLGRAAVYVNASIVEGLPIAVLEALAAGRNTVLTRLPYVTSDLAGAPGVHVAPPGAARPLADALRSALTAPHDADARRSIASWAAERFSAATAGERVVRLLETTARGAA
ncbi:glycosyltransferase family 4 protein [Amnibacterium kyonggiense]